MSRRQALIRSILFISVWVVTGLAWGESRVVSERVRTLPGYWTAERLASARPLPLPRVRDLTRDLQRPGGFTPQNYGSGGLDFSSSRLVPAEAHRSYPYSPLGRLFFSLGSGDFVCTGAAISARVVLTAGHCVFDTGLDEFASDIAFAPAYHMGDTPFGVWNANTVFVSSEWVDGDGVPNPEDWAVLVVDDLGGQALGDVVGWLGFKLRSAVDNQVTLFGYPGNHDRGEWLHRVDSGDFFDFGDGTVAYGSDMGGGSSGGPWVQNFGIKAKGQKGGRNSQMLRVVGVSSFAFTDPKVLVQGSSVLSPSFKRLFNEACDEAPGNCRRKGKPG